jgi:hypothetical protein
MKNKVAKSVLCTVVLAAAIMGVTSFVSSHVYAQGSHTEADSTPIAAVIMMTSDDQGNPMFNPMKTTIKQGEEVLVLNNLTKTHTFTNGNGTEYAMDSKIFSVEIAPGSFSEYLASNISPGNYSFYSKNDPNLNGELIILPP